MVQAPRWRIDEWWDPVAHAARCEALTASLAGRPQTESAWRARLDAAETALAEVQELATLAFCAQRREQPGADERYRAALVLSQHVRESLDGLDPALDPARAAWVADLLDTPERPWELQRGYFRAYRRLGPAGRDRYAEILRDMTAAHAATLPDPVAAAWRGAGLTEPVWIAMWRAVDDAREGLLSQLGTARSWVAWEGHQGEAPVDWDAAIAHARDAGSELPGFEAMLADAVDGQWLDGHGAVPFCGTVRDGVRVSVPFDGTAGAAQLLAHELGHAWQARLLAGRPMSQRWLSIAVSEAASLFLERRAAARLGTSERLWVRMLLQMPVRHRFELALFSQTAWTPDALDARMVALQRAGMGDRLTDADPTLWFRQGKFFTAHAPLYAWPFLFGLLYGAVVERDPARAAAVFTEVGSRSPVDVARAHLGIDLADVAVWREAIAVATR
jgi:hypothetical protein